MTFLEAYTWMSESEDNVCLRGADEYSILHGDLRFLDNRLWKECNSPIWSLNKSTWSKVEKQKVVTFHECVTHKGPHGPAELSWFTLDHIYDTSIPTGQTREVEI